MNERTDKVLQDVADGLKEYVADIEGGIETTRGHYGAYMNTIMVVAKDDPIAAKMVAAALKLAGANERGVDDALHAVIGG